MDVREKLVELLDEIQETGVNEIPAGFGCTREYVKNEKVASHLIAHGVTVQEWISVKDRLPKHNQRALVYGTANIQMVAVYDAISKGRHWLICGTWYVEMTQEVTHWMPLPPAPKGE